MNLEILETYGWPTLIIITIATFFWKALWPMVVNHMAAMNEFLKVSQDHNQKLVTDFMAALERRDKISADTVAELKTLSRLLERKK